MTHSTDLPCPISQCLARWSTAAYPDAAETSSFDLWSLSSHVQHCSGRVSHTERLHRFADVSSVEAFLDELAAKEPPRVVKLPRAPGARESRWAHLLCGDVVAPAHGDASAGYAHAAHQGPATDELQAEITALREEQARMAAEIASLRHIVTRLADELGLDTGSITPD